MADSQGTPTPYSKQSVERLGVFDERARRVFLEYNVTTVGDLAALKPHQILRVHGTGRKTLDAIQDRLVAHGFSLYPYGCARPEPLYAVRARIRPFRLSDSGIYFIECGDAIKIGYASSVERRLSAMRTGCPLPMCLLYVWPMLYEHPESEYYAKEREFHERFAALRMHGEWFRAESPLTDFIEAELSAMEREDDRAA